MKWSKKRALQLAIISIIVILLVPLFTDVSLLQMYNCSTGQAVNCDSINTVSTNVEIGETLIELSLILLVFSAASSIWFKVRKKH